MSKLSIPTVTQPVRRGWTVSRQRWQVARQGRPWLTPVVIVVAIIVLIALVLALRGKKETTTTAKVAPQVKAVALNQLVTQASVTQTAVFEPAKVAPLVSRTGGRITMVSAPVGSQVTAGQVVAQVDGGVEPNVARVQAMGAAAALQAFNTVYQQAVASADTAIAIAHINANAAQTTTPLSEATAAKNRQLADLAVRQAEFALADANEKGIDQMIRAANIGLANAQLAQDQATLSRQLAQAQGSTNRNLGAENLQAAQVGKARALAELQAQRVGLQTQLNVAQEQQRMAQVIAPFNGEVTSLRVHVGDMLTPGQPIGEVNALAGARVRLNINEGIRDQLGIGQTVPFSYNQEEFTGTITSISDAPATTTSTWQVEILITSTPVPIQPGAIVTAQLPVTPTVSNHVFIPLDATTVRQSGVVIFSVGADDVVREHPIQVVGYAGDSVEAIVDLPADTPIVITNNRNLRDGDHVTRQNS